LKKREGLMGALCVGAAASVLTVVVLKGYYAPVENVARAYYILKENCIYAQEDWDAETELVQHLADSLKDRYTVYMDPLSADGLLERYTPSEGAVGLGMEVVSTGSGWRVGEVPIGSPAMVSGICQGDILLAVNDVLLMDLSALQNISEGETVSLTINRSGEQLTLSATARAITPIKNYIYRDLGGGLGYLRIREFMEEGMEKEIIDLLMEKQRELRGLLLDLRGNPGGRLDAALAIAEAFLPKDSVLLYEEGKDGARKAEVSGCGHPFSYPLVILQDGESASAAEVLCGALRCNHRAVVVGENSYGKNTMQRVASLPDGSALRYTCAKYYLPDGSDIAKTGITPDVAIPRREDAPGWALPYEKDVQYQKALVLLRAQCPKG